MAFSLKSWIFAASCGVAALVASPSAAMVVGYSVSINDPIFNTGNGILNVPDFQITNTAEVGSGVQLTGFSISVNPGSDLYFDFVRNEAAITDANSDLVETLITPDENNNQVGTSVLAYSFAGFDPGDVFQFEVDIDRLNDSVVVQDFREALFSSGMIEVSFSDGTTLTDTLDPADPTAESFTFLNDNTAVIPLPGALPLLLSAMALGGLVARRRSKG